MENQLNYQILCVTSNIKKQEVCSATKVWGYGVTGKNQHHNCAER